MAARSGFAVDNTNTYFAVNWAIGKDIPDEVAANADVPYNMERDSMEWVTDQIQLRKEIQFAATAFAAASWTTQVAGTTDFVKFNDYGSSDPIGVLRTQMRTVRQIIGRRPNVIAMGEIVWDRLVDHPDILDRIKGAASPGSPAIVTKNLVAAILEVDDVVVADALQVTSAEGATETRADVIDDDIIALYRPPRPSLLMPAAGYGFFWRPMTGGGQQFIRRIRDDVRKKVTVEGHTYFDYNVVAADAGVHLADAVD